MRFIIDLSRSSVLRLSDKIASQVLKLVIRRNQLQVIIFN